MVLFPFFLFPIFLLILPFCFDLILVGEEVGVMDGKEKKKKLAKMERLV